MGRHALVDRGAELLIDQNSGLRPGNATGDRRPEAIEKDPLGRGDLGRLRLVQLTLPAEHFGLEGAAMIERQDVESVVIASRHHTDPLSLR